MRRLQNAAREKQYQKQRNGKRGQPPSETKRLDKQRFFCRLRPVIAIKKQKNKEVMRQDDNAAKKAFDRQISKRAGYSA